MSSNTVQRAYELAPICLTIDDLRQRLKREGCESVDAHLSGGTLRGELKKLLKTS